MLPYRLCFLIKTMRQVLLSFCNVCNQARRDFSSSRISFFFSSSRHWQYFYISSCSIFKANGTYWNSLLGGKSDYIDFRFINLNFGYIRCTDKFRKFRSTTDFKVFLIRRKVTKCVRLHKKCRIENIDVAEQCFELCQPSFVCA